MDTVAQGAGEDHWLKDNRCRSPSEPNCNSARIEVHTPGTSRVINRYRRSESLINCKIASSEAQTPGTSRDINRYRRREARSSTTMKEVKYRRLTDGK